MLQLEKRAMREKNTKRRKQIMDDGTTVRDTDFDMSGTNRDNIITKNRRRRPFDETQVQRFLQLQ